jgi:hypothetical protein
MHLFAESRPTYFFPSATAQYIQKDFSRPQVDISEMSNFGREKGGIERIVKNDVMSG